MFNNNAFERKLFAKRIDKEFKPGDKVRVIDGGITSDGEKVVDIPRGVCYFKDCIGDLTGMLSNCPVCVVDTLGKIWALGFFCVLEKVSMSEFRNITIEPDPNKKVRLDQDIYFNHRNFLEKQVESLLKIPAGATPITIDKSKIKVKIVKLKR